MDAIGKWEIKTMRQARLRQARQNGVTLLEVLLYIALFSILCISIIFLYISISRTAYSIKSGIQRAEFSFFVYEICRYKIDRYGASASGSSSGNLHRIRIEDFSRVMQFYPSFKMEGLAVEADGTASTSAEASSLLRIKITYNLVRRGINPTSDKIFSNTLYIKEL